MPSLRFITIIYLILIITSCGGSSKHNTLPTAVASANKLTFTEGEKIYLDGSASSDTDGDKLTYQWEYTYSGKKHTLEGVKPVFEAPEVETKGSALKIKLTVVNERKKQSTSNLNIKIDDFYLSPEVLSLADKCGMWFLSPNSNTHTGSHIFKQTRINCRPRQLLTSQDFETIKKLTTLENIILVHDGFFHSNTHLSIEKFPDLSGLHKLKTLFIQRIVFKNLDNLKSIKNLSHLTLADTNLTMTFSHIAKISQLEYLRLYNAVPPEELNFSSLSALKTLLIEPDGNPLPEGSLYQPTSIINLPKSLEKLVLIGRKRTDLHTPLDLSGLARLKSITIRNHSENILQNLLGLTQLESLDIRDNQLSFLPDFSALSQLKSLDISNNQLSLLPDLSKLKNLQTLKANINYFSSINISSLEKLTSINIQDNKLIQLDLSNLPLLKKIILANNKLSFINGLSTLPNLFTLNIDNNLFSTIPNISSLKELFMSRNNFTAIPNLESLENLRLLDARQNNLSKFPQIPQRNNGKSLKAYFSYYKIMDISPFLTVPSTPQHDIRLMMECIDTELDSVNFSSSVSRWRPDRLWWASKDEDDRVECE